ncbi:hypothetical protein OAory_01095250 [Aspergillus oryzae]|uniref:Uncharacterized protein n=1 Tax=Aspergillus oryzae TaxID=5062 RepID=A0A1S9D4W5_ASPOZ|nr:hypothetical protein OAory_01095250 [Aspergillus oryzae]
MCGSSTNKQSGIVTVTISLSELLQHKVKRLDIPGTDAISDVGSQVAEGAHNVAEHAPTQVQSAIKTAENAVKTAESVAQDVLDKVNATMGFSLGTRHVCMGSGDQSTWSCNHTLPFDSSFLKEEVVKALQSRLGLFLTVAQYITAGCIKAFLWTGVCLIFVADSLLLLTLVKGRPQRWKERLTILGFLLILPLFVIPFLPYYAIPSNVSSITRKQGQAIPESQAAVVIVAVWAVAVVACYRCKRTSAHQQGGIDLPGLRRHETTGAQPL